MWRLRLRGHSSPGDNLLTAMPTEKAATTPAVSTRAARAQPRGRHPERVPVTDVTFAVLGVPAPLVAALAETGITAPFPIQAATLPDALAGQDILGRAQTGSGKTLGFCLPLAARLGEGHTMARRARRPILLP